MKFIYQLLIILLVSLAGELLHALIPLPVPASIYGLLLMLLCLVTKVIKPGHVEGAGSFLLHIMPLLFVPAAVGLLGVWGDVSKLLLPLAVILPVTTVIVFALSGRVTQFMLRKGKRGGQ